MCTRMRLPVVLLSVLLLLVALGPKAQAGNEPVAARNGVVAAGHALAAQAGLRILMQGGNAIDAAVATAATLGVVMSDMIGPAGSGFAVIYVAKEKKVITLDMNGSVPAAGTPDKFNKDTKRRGMLAITVPGNLKGWDAMLKRYGTMKFSQVLKPAIEYAEKGRPVDYESAFHIKRYIPELSIYPTWVKTFLKDGQPPGPGEMLVLKDLAETYKKIAAGGADVVYKGEVGKEIVRFMKENGGLITESDLANYKAIWREPIKTSYRGYTVYGMPPSSSAITWMETLNIVEGFDLKAMGHNTPEYLHTLIEATKLAYLDGYKYNADLDRTKPPVEKMLSKEHAEELRKMMDPNKVRKIEVRVASLPAYVDKGHSTTHMVVADKFGNIVSMTNTLGTFFGSGVVMGNTGLLGSNGMDWFDIDKSIWTGEKSVDVIEPGKRPRWTLSPGIIFKDDKPFLPIGGAGAETTMSGIAQPVINVIDFGMDVQKALDAPRYVWGDVYHYTGGQRVRLERGIPDSVREALAAKGHDIVPFKDDPMPLTGKTTAVMFVNEAMMGGYQPYSRDWVVGY